MKIRLTNKTFGLLFFGSGLLATSLLVSCTVNVKHSNTGIKQETKKETQGSSKPTNPVAQKTQEPKSSQKQKTKNSESSTQSPRTSDWIVFEVVSVDKDTARVEVFEKKENDNANRDIVSDVNSVGKKLDITNMLLEKIYQNLEKRSKQKT